MTTRHQADEVVARPWRCDVTGNPVGTDTLMVGGEQCRCQGCRAHDQQGWLLHYKELLSVAGAEISRLRSLQGGGIPWRDIGEARRDGTLYLLLVEQEESDEASTHLEDVEPGAASVTIGFNNFEHDGEDEWKRAGWDWANDYFTEGRGGRVIGFAEITAARSVSAAPEPPAAGAPSSLPLDVQRLVQAARRVAFDDQSDEAIRALDGASEAFADRVPWDDEPDEDAPPPAARAKWTEGVCSGGAAVLRDGQQVSIPELLTILNLDQSSLDAAVAAERERCAKVAEGFDKNASQTFATNHDVKMARQTARDIARCIRAGHGGGE